MRYKQLVGEDGMELRDLKMTKECTQPLRIGNIRALNGCLYRIMLERGKRYYKTLEILSRDFFLSCQKKFVFLVYALILKITKQTSVLGYALSCA